MWTPGLLCFALWIGYGVLQARRASAIRTRVLQISRPKRALAAAGLMLLGMVILFAGLGLIVTNLATNAASLSLPGWLGVAVVGLVFVHAQTLGMAMLVSIAYESVTESRVQSSLSPDSQSETTS